MALAFFAIVVWRSKIWEAGDTLRKVRPEIIALVPLVSLALAVPIAIRQRGVLVAVGYRFSAWALTPISYYGNTVGYMTPAASGELLRPALFQRVFGIPIAQGAGIVLYERLFSFFLFGVSCALALVWTGLVPLWVSLATLPLLLATFIVPGFAVQALPRLGRRRAEEVIFFISEMTLQDGVKPSDDFTQGREHLRRQLPFGMA